jgi:hypothetical protein
MIRWWARRLAPPVLVALGLLIGSVRAAAQVDPRGPLRTIRTEHFRVHFAPDHEALARRAAVEAEWAWAQLARELATPAGPVELLVADNLDVTNGFAAVFPTNRIVVYALPPVFLQELRHHGDWLRLVIVHELAHIFHLDRARGLWRAGRWLLGRNPVVFPNAFTPSWVKEGLAIHYETRLTGFGRLASTEMPLVTRAAALDGWIPAPAQWSLATSRFPLGQTTYMWGAALMGHATATGGDEGVRRFVDETATFPVPFLLDRAAARGFGASFRAMFDSLRTALRASVAGVDADAAASRWSELPRGWYAAQPRWLGTDTVVWSASNGREVPGMYRAAVRDGALVPGSVRRVAWRNSLDANAPAGLDTLIFAQRDFADPYVVRSDLYRRIGDREERLTRDARLLQPDVRADGGIVAVQAVAGGTRLVRVSRDGQRVDVVRGTGSLWAEPRWSPDGRRIAAIELLPDGVERVVLLDTTGAVHEIVAGGVGVFAAPAFTPDGRRLVWTSDRSGRMQLETAPLRTVASGTPIDSASWAEPRDDVRVASAVATGVFQPSVSPDGRFVALLRFAGDGFHVAIAPLDTTGPVARGGWYAAPRIGTDVPVPPDSTFTGPTAPYRALRQLWPRYWLPLASQGRDGSGSLGAGSSGIDIAGRHAWRASVYHTPRLGETDAYAGYRFAGLGVPTFDLAAQQQWDGTFTVVDSADAVLGTVARRVRIASVAGTWLVPRVRRSVGATLGAQVEARDFTADADSVLGGPTSLLRRGTRYPSLFASGFLSTTRGGIRALSAEEGFSLNVSASHRWRSDDRSLRSWRLVGVGRGFVPLDLPGMTRHVLATRVAAGWTDARAASEFTVGGVSGTTAELLPGLSVGDPTRTFPVRGAAPGVQRGVRSLGASLEYRAPLALLTMGRAPLPVFADRLSMNLFGDAAHAWCPAAVQRTAPFYCARTDGWVATVGGELSLDLALQYDLPYRVRAGVAAPVSMPVGVARRMAAFVTLGSNF